MLILKIFLNGRRRGVFLKQDMTISFALLSSVPVCYGGLVSLGGCRFTFEGHRSSPSAILADASATMTEYSSLLLSATTPPNHTPGIEIWAPPSPPMMKFNSDGAWRDGLAAFGCLVRDHQGIPHLTNCGKSPTGSSALHSELLAVVERPKAGFDNGSQVLLLGNC